MDTVKNRKPNTEKRYGVSSLEDMPSIKVTIEVESNEVNGNIPTHVEEFGELESVILIGLPKRSTIGRTSKKDEDTMGLTYCVGAVDKVNAKMFLAALENVGEKLVAELTGLPPELAALLGMIAGGKGRE